MVIDRLARKHGISVSRRRFRARCGEGEIGPIKVVLIKPQTYMNRSGLPVRDILDDHGSSAKDLIVIHDDIDMDLGRIRIRRGGGHGGHKGLQSIIQTTAARGFIRLKIGIGRPEKALEVTEHVLHPFDREEKAQLDRILPRGVEAIEMMLLEGVEKAMSTFNVAAICEKVDK